MLGEGSENLGHMADSSSRPPPPPGEGFMSPPPQGEGWVGDSWLFRRRDRHFLRGDELEQHGHALLGLLDAALDRRDDVLRLGYPLAVAAEGAGHGGIVAGDVG